MYTYMAIFVASTITHHHGIECVRQWRRPLQVHYLLQFSEQFTSQWFGEVIGNHVSSWTILDS